MSACETLVANATAGAAPALRAVDCMANEAAAGTFGRLFGSGGAMVPALTIILTLYIAFFAISLLTGRSRIGISALTPRMMTLGLVLTFATSWAAYQGVVWNLATGAPDQIAGVLLGARGSATQLFADRIDMVFAAIAEAAGGAAASQQAAAQAAGQAASQAASGSFTPGNLMWIAALLLLLGTVGVLVTARIALAVLLAIGPVFVVFALFSGTRGLFVGWLRGVVLTAVTPLFAVLGGGFMLELAVPVVAGLRGAEGIDGRAAMALFMIAAVHVALMAMVLKVAGTMVSSWQVFGLAPERDRSDALSRPMPLQLPAPAELPAGASGAQASPVRRAPVMATAERCGDAECRRPGQCTGLRAHEPHRNRPYARRRIRPAAASRPARARHWQPVWRPPSQRPPGDDPMIRPLIAAAVLIAATTTPASARDTRLVTHRYNGDEVVRIEGRAGVQATIAFADDEHIENVAIGDSNSWQVTPNKRANLLFVKPLAARARTNLTVVTDRHSYYFDLVAAPGGNALYVLRFTYPDAPRAAGAQRGATGTMNETEAEALSATPLPIAAPADPAALNFAWRMKGDSKLIPARIYDDGAFTFLAWAAGTPIPAFLERNEKGEEGPVNFAVRGDVIVIDGVPATIVLRSGKNMATLEHKGPPRKSGAVPEPAALATVGPSTAPALYIPEQTGGE